VQFLPNQFWAPLVKTPACLYTAARVIQILISYKIILPKIAISAMAALLLTNRLQAALIIFTKINTDVAIFFKAIY
jgi:hypothetical protein